MNDIRQIRSDPNSVKEACAKRGMHLDDEIDEILELDRQKRALINESEQRKAQQNEASRKISRMKQAGEDVSAIMAEMKTLADQQKEDARKLNVLEDKLKKAMLLLPNLPDRDVLPGGKENNRTVHVYGEKPEFDFQPKNHVELCESLKMIDYERGAKLSGTGSWVYRGMGARLEWALLNFFIDEHIRDGYELILPPHMLGEECGYTAGQFPKFEDEVYWIQNPTGSERRFLLPTAETALVNLHRGEILTPDELPKKYIAYTPCYRREAGSYRAEERGMIRGHQFNKVEMVQYTAEEDSDSAFDELVRKAETLVQKLGLHYRLEKLAAGDCSFSMARTYDIEIWIPSMGIYKEVSSASNARAYQARRGNIRYRGKDGKMHFVHTLNASGLATSRVLPALVEQCQNADGSVRIPPILRPYLGGMEVIR